MPDLPFAGLNLDDLRPQPKELMFRGQALLLPSSSPIPTIMAAVALQESLRDSVEEIQELAPAARAAAVEYEEAAAAYRVAAEAEYEDDKARSKIVTPLEEAFEACQSTYVEVMTKMADAEGRQAGQNAGLLDIVMELIRDIPGQEDTAPLRVTTDEAFQIIAYVGGAVPGRMLDDAVVEAVIGEADAEVDPTTPQPSPGETPSEKPSKPSQAAKPRRPRKPSPAPS